MDLSGFAIVPLRSRDVALARASRESPGSVLLVTAASAEHATQLERELALRPRLDPGWAARPLELLRYAGQLTLVLEDPGADPLDCQLSGPLEVRTFLCVAIGIADALSQVHASNLIHKDLRPSNILADAVSGRCWLIGFGLASPLGRILQESVNPEFVAANLPYVSPEQTGRMNRLVDERSDLYSLGVTCYEMLTGALPFSAVEPLEWIHCHIARQPTPPSERAVTTPGVLSAIVMKLLAKTPEERYQTAAGAKADLLRCQAEWESKGSIAEFPLGLHDTPQGLSIPETLYGRQEQIEALTSALGRVVSSGARQLVLVSGSAGVGKTSLVQELYKALTPSGCLLATGKCDQYKSDIPYASLGHALQGMARSLLSQSDAALAPWRQALSEALGTDSQLAVNLVPELAAIIGEQLPVADRSADDEKVRFQLLMRRFLGVFARQKHPLVLVLDDLQWLDIASLDVLEDLLTGSDLQHLLLVGTYRDNEVGPDHPLRRTLQGIAGVGCTVTEIRLTSLTPNDLVQLLADWLRCDTDTVTPLAQLIHAKTAGNPFFARRFVAALTAEGLLVFDHRQSKWSWDIPRIESMGYSDNVIDLMVSTLSRLPPETQAALQHLACLGNIADLDLISKALERSAPAIQQDLHEAVRAGLVVPSEGGYRFVHDRVHEAAYALIPEQLRGAVHLRIGRLMVAQVPPAKRTEAIFEIVNQLNRASNLLTATAEREQLAGFNLLAGKRAQASSAYVSALGYLTMGAALLTEDRWQFNRELSFALELLRAHCEFASGSVMEAEERVRALSLHCETRPERIAVACLQVDIYQAIDRSDQAVAVGLSALRRLGIDIPSRPTETDARVAYENLWSRLGGRRIEDLLDLPSMSDPELAATLDLLIRVAVPGFFDSCHLFAVAVCTAVSLGLEHGHSDASCIAYVQLGTLAGPHFGQFDAGYRFGRLGCELVERPALQRFQARTLETFGFVAPWTQNFRIAREYLVRAFDIANRIGEVSYAGYACGQLNTNLLMAGDALIDVQRQAEYGLALAQKIRFGMLECWILGHLGLIRSLRGVTARFGCLGDLDADEVELENRLARNPALALPESWYYIRKLQARFMAGDYAGALQAASMAEPTLWISVSLQESVEYHFYDALCHAAMHDSEPAEARAKHRAALAGHLQKLETWALHCAENFATRAALVAAEAARIDGRELDAERLYERAIESAHAAGLVHNEALANELAARFYAARGFIAIGTLYFQNAKGCYERWGATGKVRQMEQQYPQLVPPSARANATGTLGASFEQLDLAALVRASQAVAAEIEFDGLLDTLMKTALENAGAERGLLLLQEGDRLWLQAEATVAEDKVRVRRQHARITPHDLPESILHYVLRTREDVLLGEATKEKLFSQDEYVRTKGSRSILCLPLLKQGQLIGALYLENHLVSHAFTPARFSLLRLLASQTAASLENARLYSELRAAEEVLAQAQSLGQTGSALWRIDDGEIQEIEWSVENYRIFEIDPLERIRPDRALERVHPDDRARVRETLQCAIANEARFVSEHRLKMPNGTVKHLRVIGQPTRPATGGLCFIGASLDMTSIREAQERLSKAQADLADASRKMRMGEFAASIAHEVTQPLAGILTNAESCLQWLAKEQPNLEKARQAAERITRDGNRAAKVIRSIREQAHNVVPKMALVDLNRLIGETLELIQSDLQRNDIFLDTQLNAAVGPIRGDPTQLQQVIVNLVMNAIEAMRTSGMTRVLRVLTQPETTKVLVSVEDSGPGIDATNAQRIFEPAFTTKTHGMGLGLAICRSIVEEHGGRIWWCANPGGGSIFRFALPLPG